MYNYFVYQQCPEFAKVHFHKKLQCEMWKNLMLIILILVIAAVLVFLKIKYVSLPSTVTLRKDIIEIRDGAFQDCPKLTDGYYAGTED